ncbi:MAG: MATE family efflux transporter [bacterium]
MDLTRGRIPKVLLLFSLPIIGQMSIQPLYQVVDRIFIGQIGPEAFKAVTNAAVLQMLVIMLSAGIANGVTSYVARLIGSGEYAEADNAANHAVLLILALSFLYIAVAYPLDRHFFAMLELEPALVEQAHDYIKVIILGNITIMFSLIGANILRGEGNSTTPFWLAFIAIAINLVLDPLLMFGPEDQVFGFDIGWMGLGVMGASIATVVGRGVGAFLLILYLLRGKSIWTFSLKNFHWYPRHILEILRVGFPMLLVNLCVWIANIVFLRILNPIRGAAVAYGMGIQFDMMAILPMIGLMLGVVSMVGQNYGAGDLDRARRSAWTGALYGALFSLAMGLVYILFPDFWVSLFNKENDPVIQQLGREYIFIVGLTYTMASQVFVLGGAFQGLGKGMPPLIITATRFLAVAIPLAIILTRYMGATGAWIAVAASHVVGGVFAITWIGIEFRKRKKTL